MKIRECKDYLNNCISLYKDVSKKHKLIAGIFTIIVSILCIVPIVSILINLFMQFLGIKVMIVSLIALCGILLHFAIALLYPIYFISLNVLSDLIEEKISYRNLFISLICDWVQIIFIIIMIVAVSITVLNMLF